MEELQKELVGARLDQRADGRVTEGGVGGVNGPCEVLMANVGVSGDEGPEHGHGQLRIGLASERTDLRRRKGRIDGGDVEAAYFLVVNSISVKK